MLDEEREKNRELRTQIERLQNRVCSNTIDAQTHWICECNVEKNLVLSQEVFVSQPLGLAEPVLAHYKHLCGMRVSMHEP